MAYVKVGRTGTVQSPVSPVAIASSNRQIFLTAPEDFHPDSLLCLQI
ncbi:hypothetical protein [Leptolyngbya sp. GGD]|nr:hypothetical protein [Leptolyngbya sp. GGD]MCY6492439.1 hypothetical protein [Leptolyngbya sp. GGD]